MTSSGIYIIRNLISDKVYIGSTVNIKRRREVHYAELRGGYHPNLHLQNSWNKHGEGAFEFKTLIHCRSDREILLHYEQRVMDIYLARLGKKKLYNITLKAGSCLGIRHTPEACAKQSAAQKGRKLSPEARAKISASHKGKRHSPKHRAANSAAHKGNKASPETRDKMSTAHKERYLKHGSKLSGRKYSPEHCAKLSAARKGKPLSPAQRKACEARKGKKLSPEHRAKLSAANKGKKRSPEVCAKQSARMKGAKHSLKTRAKMKGKIPWNKGRKNSPEFCANISARQKGKPWTPARRKAHEERKMKERKLEVKSK